MSAGGAAEPEVSLAGECEVPLRCFRCRVEFSVPFRHFRAGVVIRCPRCRGSFVPRLRVCRAVETAIAGLRAGSRGAPVLSAEEERRRREALAAELLSLTTAERAPGAPPPGV